MKMTGDEMKMTQTSCVDKVNFCRCAISLW